MTQQKKGKNKDALINYFIQKCGADKISDECYKYLTEKARMLNNNLSAKWEKCHRRLDDFQIKYSGWLCSETVINKQINFEIASTETQCTVELSPDEKVVSLTGRPQLKYSEKSERSKRRQAANLSMSQHNETNMLVQAASISARKQGQVDLAVVLKESIESPSRPSKIRKLYVDDVKAPIVMSDEEALAFLLENNFSKSQYCSIRTESKQRNANIYPPYDNILAIKSKCRPDGVLVDDKCAKVPLQMLLTHTAKRIIEMQNEVFATITGNFISTEMIFSYGFDSSSGQSQYKQSLNEFKKYG